MILRIDHVGILVEDLDAAIKFYEKLGFSVENRFEVKAEKGRAATIRKVNSKIELFEFENKETPLAKIVEHHIGFETNDIQKDLELFLSNGYELILPIASGTVVKQKCFVKSADNQYVELIKK